jgi:hypothetical protein
MLSSRDSRIAGSTKHLEGRQAYSVIRKQLIILGTVFSGVYSSVSLQLKQARRFLSPQRSDSMDVRFPLHLLYGSVTVASVRVK